MKVLNKFAPLAALILLACSADLSGGDGGATSDRSRGTDIRYGKLDHARDDAPRDAPKDARPRDDGRRDGAAADLGVSDDLLRHDASHDASHDDAVASSDSGTPPPPPPPAVGLGIIELIFDDGDDNSGYADGHEEINNLAGGNKPRFVGGAHRTTLAQGRYGRGARLVAGASTIDLRRIFDPQDGFVFGLWVKNLDASRVGWLLLAPKTLGIRVNKGALELVTFGAGGAVAKASGLSLPADGKFHFLRATYSAQKATFTLTRDFSKATQFVAANLPALSKGPSAAQLGAQLDAIVDEVILTHAGWPWPRALPFDANPKACGGAGLSCLEETLLVQPTGWPRKVAVRFKAVYRADRCKADTPCPLLFVVRGGGICNDDYDSNAAGYAQDGFFAVTIDPYCEVSMPYRQYPTETSQLVAVKKFLVQSSPLRHRLDATHYAAMGCSHGARAVGLWAMFEKDYPKRTFVNSAGNAATHCAYHSKPWMCESSRKDWDGPMPTPHNDNDPRVAQQHQYNLVNGITPQVAASREIVMVWGSNTTGQPTCTAKGFVACTEAGTGHTGGGRVFRDAWRKAEPPSAPTGLFMENNLVPCQHCIHPNTAKHAPLWSCAMCFLRHGRKQMASACPSCLSVYAGGPAPACNIKCTLGVGCIVGNEMTYP